MKSNLRMVLLLSGAAITAIWADSAAFAQQPPAEPETITVTGSRVRSTFTTPTPVTIVSTTDLQLADPGNLVAAINQLPQFYNSTTDSAPGGFFVSPGAGNFNLRSLGTQRTLTLLNGRRVVSSTRYGSTDSNTFPKEMIKSVEAVTGGASAAYGTDAISGVVNFILDTSYTGVRGHLQGGITSRGDNKNWEGSLATGFDLGDKIHVLAAAEQYEQNPIYTYAGRDWYQGWGQTVGPAGGPTFLVRPNLVSTSASLDGIFSLGTPNANPALDTFVTYEFLPDGSFRPFTVQPTPPATTIGGSNLNYQQPLGGSGTDIGADRPTIQPKTDRQSLFGYVEYNPWDNLKIFAQGIYGKNNTASTNIGGSLTQGAVATIYNTNAYLPTSVKTLMTTAGATQFSFNKLGSVLDTAREAFTITENAMTSLTGGFEYDFLKEGLFGGDWMKNWRANGYYQWGHTTYNAKQRGGFRLDRIQLALDAVVDGSGNTICRVNLPQYASVNGGRWSDCVPINLFGRGQASQAAIDWVTGYDVGQHVGPTPISYTDSGTSLGFTDEYLSSEEKIASGDIFQNVFELTLDGDIWEGWGAGAISGALGYSYRTEKMNQVVRVPDSPTNDLNTIRPVPANDPAGCVIGTTCLGVRGNTAGNIGNSVAMQFSKVPNVRGQLYTGEFFTEVLVPVVADLPLIELFSVDGAVRRAEYSGSGQIWAWKYGFSWDVLGGLRLRGAQSRDVRAGTLADRYDQTGGSVSVVDPCSTCLVLAGAVVPSGTPGAAIAAPYSPFNVAGGNPNIRPERGDTTTLGFVYQPTWLSNFSVSVDWYDIRLHGAIASFTAQQIVDGCYNGAADLCARLTRDPGIGLNAIGQPKINIVNASVLNLNRNRVQGIDAQIDYHQDVSLFGGDESVSARVFASYLDEYSITLVSNTGAATTTQYAGTIFGVAYPRWKWNISGTYTRGPFSIYVQERYIDQLKLNQTYTEGYQIDDNSVDAAFYTDVNLSYRLNRWGGDWSVFLNVNNLLDSDPPVVATWAQALSPSAIQTLPSTYDLLGRRFTGGIRFSF